MKKGALCLTLCFLLLSATLPSLAQYAEVWEMVRYLIASQKEVREVLAIIQGFRNVPEDEKTKMIKEVEKYGNQQRVGGFYDVVVEANSLRELDKGWNIAFNSTTHKEKYLKKMQTTVIGFTGVYDSGKTFLLNEYINGSLSSGVQVETVGLSMMFRDNTLWLDSAGSKRAISNERLEDRLATDHFIAKMVLHMSDVVIYLVNNLFVTDIHHINSVYDELMSINPTKKLLVVHNFLNYWTPEEVEKHIKDDVIEAFSAQKQDLQGCDRYLSHGGQVLHIILGKKGSPAGDKYNPCGMSFLRRIIQGAQLSAKEIDIFNVMTNTVQGLIPRYFFLPGQQQQTIPMVIDSVGVEHSKSGTKTNFLSWGFLSGLLKSAKQSKDWVVSSLFSGIFGKSESTTEISVIENPFAVEIVDSEQENIKQMRLKTPFDLAYMPFNGGTHPDVAFKPAHEIYIGSNRIVIVVELPDVFYHEIRCANQVTLVIRGVRDMNPSLTSLTRSKSQYNRRYGTFSITVPLPEHVGCPEVKNKGVKKDGLLTIDHTWEHCTDGLCGDTLGHDEL